MTSPARDRYTFTPSDLVLVKALMSFGRNIYRQHLWGGEYDSSVPEQVEDDNEFATANLIGSKVPSLINQHLESSMHAPTIDLDVPAYLIPSSTPGHSHLYIDVAIPEKKYWELLHLLAECGIIEKNYVRASLARGMSCVRLPHVTKADDDLDRK